MLMPCRVTGISLLRADCPGPHLVSDSIHPHLQNAVLKHFDEFDVYGHFP